MRSFRRCTRNESVEAVRRFGVSSLVMTSPLKKSLRAAEQQRADVARARRRWIREQGLLDPARLVFIDETAVSTNMVRPNGRSPRGERLIGYVPLGHWETVTFVAGLRLTGVVAPMLINGAMNGEIFLAYLEQCLAQAQRHCGGGQPSRPQSPWRRRRHRGSRRKPELSAAVFPGPQSNRDGLSSA